MSCRDKTTDYSQSLNCVVISLGVVVGAGVRKEFYIVKVENHKFVFLEPQ